CTCSAPSGSCALPTRITTGALTCAANGPPSRAFYPPPGWDGSCTSYDAIEAGDLCNGLPCVVSLTADPLVWTEQGCNPSTTTSMNEEPAGWSTAVLGCRASGDCHDESLRCQPSAAQAVGFLSCLFQRGDNDCPPSYPEKHVVYSGFSDHRACSPCSCSPPGG